MLGVEIFWMIAQLAHECFHIMGCLTNPSDPQCVGIAFEGMHRSVDLFDGMNQINFFLLEIQQGLTDGIDQFDGFGQINISELLWYLGIGLGQISVDRNFLNQGQMRSRLSLLLGSGGFTDYWACAVRQ